MTGFFLAPFSGFICAPDRKPMELSQQPVIFVVEDNIIYQGLIAKELERSQAELQERRSAAVAED